MPDVARRRLTLNGPALLRLRTGAEQSQQQAATSVGLTIQRFGQLERGGESVRLQTLGQIADTYRIDPCDLLLWNEEPSRK